MSALALREIEGRSAGYWMLLAALAAVIAAGLAAAWHMETAGHIVTGMDNQIVWGMPHVFAVFLIVAASGALNVASIASVFNGHFYKPLAPLSGWLAMALLAGGLAVLVLDLGRPERLVIAMTHYNFKSIFAWNIFLYTGFFALVAGYLWAMMDRAGAPFARPAGIAAFAWRLVLTTGTGSIFGFLVAREAYDSALLAPTFIAYSFAYGTAAYAIALVAAGRGSGRALGGEVLGRLSKLLAWFVIAALYFVAVYHLTNLYIAERHGVEGFILAGNNVYTYVFWGGQVGVGAIVPLVILSHPGMARSAAGLTAASVTVALGGLAQMYVTIIGAQAWPLELFPGYTMSSSFHDGEINRYVPSLPEVTLGIAGVAIAAAGMVLGVKLLKLLPASLADEAMTRTG